MTAISRTHCSPVLFRLRARLLPWLCLTCLGLPGHTLAQAPHGELVTALRCDALAQPLGIDDPTPTFSWQLHDVAAGALQSAYQVEVYSHSPKGDEAPDVWNSGRIDRNTSLGVVYAGPALQASTRYFWRVRLWGKNGQPYPLSAVAWWETGLLTQAAWSSHWIGYESPELHSVRTAGAAWITAASAGPFPQADGHYGFRLHFSLPQAVRSAVLYTTGQDTASAWLNDAQVMSSEPLPPWQQMPWETYKHQDVTRYLQAGNNLLAIGLTHYAIPQKGQTAEPAPMSATLYLVLADGSTKVIRSEPDTFKAAVEPAGQWWLRSTEDNSWAGAKAFTPIVGGFGSTEVGRPWPTGPAVLLRRSFMTHGAVVSARLYATALGAYKFSLNGQTVGDQILAPGWMDYREHVPYQVYDVTSQLHQGQNVIGAYLAPGWYSTPLKWFRQSNNYGDTQPALRAQLRLTYADESTQWIATDETWKAETSEIEQAEIYDGESIDGRRQIPGWDSPAFTASDWHAVSRVEPVEPQLLAQFFQPIRQERVMTAKTISSPSRGVYIFDFGQNMAAIPQLLVQGKRGDTIRLRFAEALNPDGTLYVDNLRTAKATDHYILSGSGPEQFRPEFTFHGFRYAEISGLRTPPTAETLRAAVLHTDAPFTVQLDTGDRVVNQLWSNVLWGQRSNFVGVPTDCPQRDERLGWTADAQVFWRTAAFNMDLNAFSQKFSTDLRGTQVGTAMYGIFAPGVDIANPGYGAGWSDAGVIIPWSSWIQTGNRKLIDQNWTAMQHYLAEIEAKNPDHLWRNGFGAAFGDWLTPTVTTPEDLVATAYWAYDADLMRQMALATGRTAEAAFYATMHDRIKLAFQQAYVQPDGTVGAIDRYPSIPPPTVHPEPGDGQKDHFVETQTGYVLALHMDLLPQNLRAGAATRLVAKLKTNHYLLGTGFLGTPYLLEVLSDTGHSDLAYTLLLNKDYPSWGYLIDHGATTTWERWNGDQMRGDPSMNSYNHYAYGAVAEWIYRYAAGIDTVPGDPGFHTVLLHPNFDARLGHLNLDYDSGFGKIHSDWLVNGANVIWHLVIPANTQAEVSSQRINAQQLLLDGQPLESALNSRQTKSHTFTLNAGQYTITGKLANRNE